MYSVFVLDLLWICLPTNYFVYKIFICSMPENTMQFFLKQINFFMFWELLGELGAIDEFIWTSKWN